MRFRELISEGDEYSVLLDKYMDLSQRLMRIAPTRDGYVEDFDDELYDGKDLSVELKKFEAMLKEMKLIVDKLQVYDKFKREWSRDALRDVKTYTDVLKAYRIKNENIQNIITCVNKGENQDIALKKLSALSMSAVYYNLETKKSVSFFDTYTVDDLKSQIEEYKGHVVLRGAMDLNITFKNEKVLNVYF